MGATLTWKRYQPRRPAWEHEHCEFCFHKFLDPNYASSHAKMLSDDPVGSSDAGYTNVHDSGRPAGEWWVCRECFSDFEDEFHWTVAHSDPDGWPYEPPAPDHALLLPNTPDETE